MNPAYSRVSHTTAKLTLREMLAVEDEWEAAFAALHESTWAANDRFGEEDMDEWLAHAVDEGDE